MLLHNTPVLHHLPSCIRRNSLRRVKVVRNSNSVLRSILLTVCRVRQRWYTATFAWDSLCWSGETSRSVCSLKSCLALNGRHTPLCTKAAGPHSWQDALYDCPSLDCTRQTHQQIHTSCHAAKGTAALKPTAPLHELLKTPSPDFVKPAGTCTVNSCNLCCIASLGLCLRSQVVLQPLVSPRLKKLGSPSPGSSLPSPVPSMRYRFATQVLSQAMYVTACALVESALLVGAGSLQT